MADSDETRKELLEELRGIRRRLEALETQKAGRQDDKPSVGPSRRDILKAAWASPIILSLGLPSRAEAGMSSTFTTAFYGTPEPTTARPTTTTKVPTTASTTTATTAATADPVTTTAATTTTTVATTTLAPTTTTLAPTTTTTAPPVPVVPLLDPDR